MTIKSTTNMQIEIRKDEAVMSDISEIAKHDNVTEQEALRRSLQIFLPEGGFTPGQQSNNLPGATQPARRAGKQHKKMSSS